nr:MAG TPA: hypothetical protein [Caudoviricetes sp.]
MVTVRSLAMRASLHAQIVADVGQHIDSVDSADEIELADFHQLRAVDGKFQVVEFQLGLAFHFFGGFELAQSDLLRHGLAHQLERLLYEGARTGIELLDGPAGFEVVPHGLQQGRCAGRGHVPLDFERQGLELPGHGNVHFAGDAEAREGLGEVFEIGQLNGCNAQKVDSVTVDFGVGEHRGDAAGQGKVGCACHGGLSLCGGREKRVEVGRVVLEDEHQLASGLRRGDVHMPANLAGEQVAGGVVREFEGDPRPKQKLASHKPVEPDIEGFLHCLDHPEPHRIGNELPAGQDERVADPVEHAPDRDAGVLHVGIAGITGCLIAPCHKPADHVESGHDAVAVQVGGFGWREMQFPAGMDQAFAGELIVARAPVGDTAVGGVAGGDDAGKVGRAALGAAIVDGAAVHAEEVVVRQVVVVEPRRNLRVFLHFGGHVDEADGAEMAADVLAGRSYGLPHCRIAGKARSQNLSGDETEPGKGFLGQRQPGTTQIAVDAADDVFLADLADIRLCPALLAFEGRRVLGGIEDVDGHKGFDLVPFEIEAGHFVQGVVGRRLALLQAAHAGDEFGHAVIQLRFVDRGLRAFGEVVYGGGAHYDGQRRFHLHGRHQSRSLFLYVYAVSVSHGLLLRRYSLPCMVQCVITYASANDGACSSGRAHGASSPSRLPAASTYRPSSASCRCLMRTRRTSEMRLCRSFSAPSGSSFQTTRRSATSTRSNPSSVPEPETACTTMSGAS